MDLSIAAILSLDGAANGAVYALLALATVLVFLVTRIIFIPQGEFVAYGALTFAALHAQQTPGVLWLLLSLAILAGVVECGEMMRRRQPAKRVALQVLGLVWPPLLVCAAVLAVTPTPSMVLQGILAVALVTALGPLIYRLAYQRLADASVLVLLIVSVGVHFALTGLGLYFFGPEGSRNPTFWDAEFATGAVTWSGQTLITFAVMAVIMAALYYFFERTLQGKALRATAVNRLGARLMGISTQGAGKQALTLAAFIGAMSGLLIGSTTTMFYDSGFLIGLKGFVAAIVGGLASYPLAALGALFVGVLESFGSFWASSFKEVIVFTLILPILFWRSLGQLHNDEEE
ncbi:branched-chain amino acid transport system permease protein [Variovorax boronicumulans]|uniref:branched-chain amino acid ABC transporter permease n=1 Tax=Variovorax boronicumulans TaxID=436515 RepID=UPI002789C84C|nr:branched-chain amino acid ABC transporter permease [Variovorax boronicumulans]MDP9995737.1 branched-chain amino acid transport system permease protein [Variovorax boronicumulans]MDQ0006798.1 branched-chain amino acid transport system permease protein [Variovorax boronicumulans]MDQ0036745.1 branched-chain amino acid transport system permease protein [Variovorax boronicumulans]MDQ0044575.1 branched-chain amino acid transport system permease protein [Variovorax boronicumulans]